MRERRPPKVIVEQIDQRSITLQVRIFQYSSTENKEDEKIAIFLTAWNEFSL